MTLSRAGRTLAAAAAAALLLAAAPTASATTSGITGSISPQKVRPGIGLGLTLNFTLDPQDGQSSTLAKTVMRFPSNATVNGGRFPVCTAAMINAVRGSFRNCPKGSKIGGGTLKADVPAIELPNVPGRVTLFNGRGGKSITVHIYATNPVMISEAFDAPLVKTSGRYGYKLTAVVPYSLQEINDGWFVELRRFSTTVKATWRGTPYIVAKRCPRSGRAPIDGAFSFLRESAPTSAAGFITCKS